MKTVLKERAAEFASKQVIQNLLCRYAKQFSGKSFSGYITGVKEFGLFVDIPKLFTSGLLHVNDLPNDFYRYNARHQSLDGRRRGNKFSLGDRIDVFIGDIKELEEKFRYIINAMNIEIKNITCNTNFS